MNSTTNTNKLVASKRDMRLTNSQQKKNHQQQKYTQTSAYTQMSSVRAETKLYIYIQKMLEIHQIKKNTWRGVRETTGIDFFLKFCIGLSDIIERCALAIPRISFFGIFFIFFINFVLHNAWVAANHAFISKISGDSFIRNGNLSIFSAPCVHSDLHYCTFE